MQASPRPHCYAPPTPAPNAPVSPERSGIPRGGPAHASDRANDPTGSRNPSRVPAQRAALGKTCGLRPDRGSSVPRTRRDASCGTRAFRLRQPVRLGTLDPRALAHRQFRADRPGNRCGRHGTGRRRPPRGYTPRFRPPLRTGARRDRRRQPGRGPLAARRGHPRGLADPVRTAPRAAQGSGHQPLVPAALLLSQAEGRGAADGRHPPHWDRPGRLADPAGADAHRPKDREPDLDSDRLGAPGARPSGAPSAGRGAGGAGQPLRGLCDAPQPSRLSAPRYQQALWGRYAGQPRLYPALPRGHRQPVSGCPDRHPGDRRQSTLSRRLARRHALSGGPPAAQRGVAALEREPETHGQDGEGQDRQRPCGGRLGQGHGGRAGGARLSGSNLPRQPESSSNSSPAPRGYPGCPNGGTARVEAGLSARSFATVAICEQAWS